MVVWYLTLMTISVARGQVSLISPSDGKVILYRLDRIQGSYLFCMSFELPEKDKVSLIVIGDTFSVQPHGEVCGVTMSNAYILQTSSSRSPSNEVVQIKFRTDVYKFVFPKYTKIVFNNSIVELPNVKIEAPAEANTNIYDGYDALNQFRKLGVKPPEDIDREKAVDRQKH